MADVCTILSHSGHVLATPFDDDAGDLKARSAGMEAILHLPPPCSMSGQLILREIDMASQKRRYLTVQTLLAVSVAALIRTPANSNLPDDPRPTNPPTPQPEGQMR